MGGYTIKQDKFTQLCPAVILFIFFLSGCAKKLADEPVSYPQFQNEVELTLSGYDADAMEPFISADGNTLFFNSINDGVDTSIYYATGLDSSFTVQGKVPGVNGTQPHLDAVASMDNNNAFFFVSTRNYPLVIENLQTGAYSSGTVTSVTPVAGDFYISSPAGWLIMDAEINRDGNCLCYVNAHFTGSIPDTARLGLAIKTGASFLKTADSDAVFANINSSSCLVYAPSLSQDMRELYFTRLCAGAANTQICVAVRDNASGVFSAPLVISISGELPEAPSISYDGTRLYYHKKNASGIYRIYMMTRK